MNDEPILNPMRERPFSSIAEARYSRRDMLGAAGKLGIAAAFAGMLKPAAAFAQTANSTTSATPLSTLTFAEIAKHSGMSHRVAEGYDANLLIRWGDRLTATASAFDPLAQSAENQQQQFGYNNDFLAYMPFPLGSRNSNHGLLCANHEYSSSYLMFPDLPYDDTIAMRTTKAQVEVEMASQGHSVVEVRRVGEKWEPVIGSPYNRRISPYATDIAVSGPAAGHARMQTAEDPSGKLVRGTFANCAGGVTPWGTVLTCEENFDGNFMGILADESERANAARYGLGLRTWYGWGRFYDRYDLGKEPREANRFGWVVEYDPYDPESQPVKRTWLGRCKHETANTTLAPDGRVVVYTGDDERFEYIYRYVSNGKYNPDDRKANSSLLDDGMLYVAKFHEDGSMEWLPLEFGKNGLTPENGFHSQGEVLIETRRAGDILGATPMDRPEGVAIHPATGQVFVAMTNNDQREMDGTNAANPRGHNLHGHIVELLPPSGDHAATQFSWRMFLKAGNPADKGDAAMYLNPPSEHGWLSCPDNLTIDPSGRLWIASDGQPKTIALNDSLYACETFGAAEGLTRHFFSGPAGCEVTGPCFTPDGKTLFLSVQHPGDGKSASFNEPSSRWPDFRADMPPRPSVLAITKNDDGIIGS